MDLPGFMRERPRINANRGGGGILYRLSSDPTNRINERLQPEVVASGIPVLRLRNDQRIGKTGTPA